MRISADQNDSGYQYFAMLQANREKVTVLLDGVEVKCCTTADDEQGFVVRCVLDESGVPQIDPTDRELIWEERVTGDVEIKIEDAPAPSEEA